MAVIDVIIVSHNTCSDLLACLSSLDGSQASVASLTVVDNASTDDSVATVRARWPGVRLMPVERNVGFGAANNLALRRATADYVLFLNSDTIVPPGAIDRLLDRLVAAGATAAGPMLVDGAGNAEMSFGSMLTPFTELAQRARVRAAGRGDWLSRWYVARRLAVERQVDWVTGACLLVGRQAAIDAGGFDERFFLYEEDVDFCAALRARGGRILYTPAVRVTHLRGRSMQQPSPDAPRHYDRSHVAFYEKHAPGWAPWLRRWLRLRGRAIG